MLLSGVISGAETSDCDEMNDEIGHLLLDNRFLRGLEVSRIPEAFRAPNPDGFGFYHLLGDPLFKVHRIERVPRFGGFWTIRSNVIQENGCSRCSGCPGMVSNIGVHEL